MFSIGDFARYGRVSVRMLRHYDAIGLLRPARVDPATGYRYYRAAQLSRLNRIIALRDLGFGLDRVAAVLDESIGAGRLRDLLRRREDELRERIAADRDRLARVAARLTVIESEGRMPTHEIVVKPLPPVRVAERHATAASFAPEDVGPVIGPLYEELEAAMARAGVAPTGPGLAYYVDDPAGGVVVHAGITVAAGPDPAYGFDVVDLPGVPAAATVVHHGALDRADPAVQAMARWADDNGYRVRGYIREYNLECPPGEVDAWVTELQQPLTR